MSVSSDVHNELLHRRIFRDVQWVIFCLSFYITLSCFPIEYYISNNITRIIRYQRWCKFSNLILSNEDVVRGSGAVVNRDHRNFSNKTDETPCLRTLLLYPPFSLFKSNFVLYPLVICGFNYFIGIQKMLLGFIFFWSLPISFIRWVAFVVKISFLYLSRSFRIDFQFIWKS